MPQYDFKQNFNIRFGVLTIAEAAIVSFTLSSGLLVYSLNKGWETLRHQGAYGPNDENPLQSVSVLFLFAVFCDMIQSFANILSARWGFKGEVIGGSYCTAQAVLKQIGNDGVAWFTIAIAVLTFMQVIFPSVLGRDGRRYFVMGAIAYIFCFLALMIAIPSTLDRPYYGNTGLWCWIVGSSRSTRALRIWSEYAFLWLAVVVSFICYGTIVVKWLLEAAADRDPTTRRSAISMGWYPIAYFVVVAPQSIVRFLQFDASGPPHGWTVLSSILFTSGGTLNVVLWMWTGRRFGFTSAPSSNRDREQIRSITSTTGLRTGTGTGTVEIPLAWRSPRSLDSNHIPPSPSTPNENNGGGFYSFAEGAGAAPVFPAEYPASLSGGGRGVGVHGADYRGVGSRRR